jgi:WD40 repeat protein
VCPLGCGDNVPRAKLTEHATVCPNVQVPCAAAEFGCTEMVQRGNYYNHEQECRYEQSRFIFEPLHQETVRLRGEISSLTIKYMNALSEVGELKRNNDNLTNSYNQSRNDISVLNKQYTALEDKYESLESKYETIIQQLANFTTRANQLSSAVSMLMDPIEHVACGSGDNIEIWNVSAGTRVKVLEGHTHFVWSIIQLSDGTLVSASWDKTIRLWNIETSKCIKVHTGDVNCMIQLANGTIASGSDDKTIRIWNREQEIKTIQADTVALCLLELEDGTLVSGGTDEMITFWNVRSGEKIKTLTGHTDTVQSLLQLKDGRLVSASYDKTIRIWRNDKCERVLEGHTDEVHKVIELTDSQLASCSNDETIRLWKMNTGESQVLTGHTDAVRSLVQLSSDTIISSSLDTTIRVWKNGKQIKQMKCSTNVWSMAPIKLL